MAASLRRLLALPAVAALAMLGTSAEGSTRTGKLTVQATVSSACALDTATMDFGTYYSGAAVNRDAAGSIGYIKCYNTALTLELDLGQNASGSTRNMKSGASLLRYELYQDSARTKVLSTGSNAMALTSDATGAATVSIYGRIPMGQVVSPGDYSDVVGIVLTF